jgi:hypothetical protein
MAIVASRTDVGTVDMLRYTWTCSCCGRQFDDLPLDWNTDAPVPYLDIPEAERAARAELADNFCTIDGDAFYIRGLIEIPIIGQAGRLAFGVWGSLSAASMGKVSEVWERPDRAEAGPFFAWLCSALPLYPNTLLLKARVHLRAPPTVPYVELEPTDHPLAVEQRHGVTLARVVEIAEALLPRH